MLPLRVSQFVLAILLLLLCSQGGWQWVRSDAKPGPIPSEWDKGPISAETKHKIQLHLDRAQDRTRQKVDRGFPNIDRLFGKAHDQVLPFANVCLGWRSKWSMVVDAMPYSKGGRHGHFLKQEFEKRIFSSQDLEQAIEETVRDYLTEIRNIESEMLVDLRADIADLPAFEAMANWNREQFESRFAQAMTEAAEIVGDDLQSNVSSQVVSLIAGEVLAQVAVRLGVSAGILGTGAASGWATFGVGLIAGLIVDQIVARVWDWWSDPDVELGLQLAAKLNALHDLICDGDDQVLGLRREFARMAEIRDHARRAAIQDLMDQTFSGAAPSGRVPSLPRIH
jgi:hypothetical protein